MGQAGSEAQALGGGRGDEAVECGHPIGIEGLQAAPTAGVFMMFRNKAGRNQSG